MEIAFLIEKIIEGYDSEKTITKIIELSLFVYEIFILKMVNVITAVQS